MKNSPSEKSTIALCIAIAQCDIAWESPEENFAKIKLYTQQAKAKGAELVVFPEAILTGFSMHLPNIAIANDSPYIEKLQQLAITENIAIALTLFIKESNPTNSSAKPNEKYYNRIFFFTPEGEQYTQDKRHLFRPAGETKWITPANKRNIFSYRGFNILMVACYDLRFPVWCRNRNNEYDLLIDMANWPIARNEVWRTLVRARAMENLAYVCGVNRVGSDSDGLSYKGSSAIVDAKGRTMAEVDDETEGIALATIEKAPLDSLRNKFPVWMDADGFELDPEATYPIL